MEYVRLDQSKRCIKCKQIKAIEDFGNSKSYASGKKSTCKYCCSIAYKEWALNNKEHRTEYNRKYSSENREQVRANKNAWNQAHPEKARARTRAWVAANPEKKRANNIAWEKANREKMRAKERKWAANNPQKVAEKNLRRQGRVLAKGIFRINKKEIEKLLSMPCFYCGQTKNQSLDHVIPVSRGGTHSIGNLVTACRSCNSSKRDRTIMEWRKRKT